MPATWSQRGLANLRKQNAATLDVELVFYDGTTALPAQPVSLRRLAQQELPEGEAIATPGGTWEIRGGFDLVVKSGFRFTWDGLAWEVTQTAAATQTNTSVARRALAVSKGKASS